mmetsp:Transcript_30242/g.59065  ORF Transcript_30242/g.59065 Transcript_30242/m.59065 type:complete len:110 (+) Transcript_30242:231-560(+)
MSFPTYRPSWAHMARDRPRFSHVKQDLEDALIQLFVQAAGPGGPQQHEVNEDEDMCVICMEGKATWTSVPCGHRSLCKTCAEHLRDSGRQCPLCRADVSSVMQVFGGGT